MTVVTSGTASRTPVFTELNRGTTVQNLPLSHLSVEVGHFYMEDLENGEEPILAQFERVRPWLEAAEKTAVTGGEKARVSTCFLIDDYFQRWPDASKIVARLLRLSQDAGVRIDYIARESSCAVRSDGVRVAELVARRLLQEPEPEAATGSRPAPLRHGWLANGKPAREERVLDAMQGHAWEPAVEYSRRNHSIFLDVELWRDPAELEAEDDKVLDGRLYSCPFLAAVWQLVRLGLLRSDGAPALAVSDRPAQWPDDWAVFPDIVKVNPAAKPFYAYRAFSIMPQHFLGIEHAVRTIVDHFLVDPGVAQSLAIRAAEKGVPLPASVANRISHHFLDGGY
ncbi:SCO2522 family protein [Catenulispora yoronensis]|uniref:SCO2522 family protein n=1 Tax=Catenulispora yoronensis TaxID=450799 RepID=A0ABP5GR32_9ACTN